MMPDGQNPDGLWLLEEGDEIMMSFIVTKGGDDRVFIEFQAGSE